MPPPAGPPRPRLGRRLLGIALTILTAVGTLAISSILALLLLAAVVAALLGGSDGGPERLSSTRIDGPDTATASLLVVPVHGVITGGTTFGGGGLFALEEAPGYAIKRQLALAARDSSIRGILLDMNTPGGTVFGAKAIADGVQDYQEQTGRPVVAFVSGVSASGGMYAMAPAQRILADAGTLVGSIGVIAGPFATYRGVTGTEGGILGGGVQTRGGIDYTVFSQGQGKDFGSPYRPFTAKEKRLFNRQLADAYAGFVTHVARSRNIATNVVRNRIGAYIYGPTDAQALGLIDAGATRQEAEAELAERAKVRRGEYQIRQARQSSGGGGLFARARDEALGGAAAARERECPLMGVGVLAYWGDATSLCRAG